jgi:hypothetical protein
MDDIWSEISKASIVVAELTGKNPNVYYELGLAHAIRKPAILISSNIEDVPFDLRPLRVFIYDKNVPDWGAKLKLNISKAIVETLSSPIESIPHTFRNYEPAKTSEEVSLVERLSFVENKLNDLVIDSSFISNTDKIFSRFGFDIGDIVKHVKFGRGQIVNFEGTGDHVRAQIHFDEAGSKWLVLAFSRLVKL